MLTPYTKDFEIVDVTSVVICISLGVWPAIVYAVSAMMVSRIFGPSEWFMFTVKDSIALSVALAIIPWFYFIWNGNMIYMLFTFTALRYFMYMVATVFMEPDCIMLELYYTSISIPVACIQNSIAGSVLGGYLVNLIGSGIRFHWELPGILLLLLGGTYLFRIMSDENIGEWLHPKPVKIDYTLPPEAI
ncbi:MAG TPA: hypothetical protein ENN45_00820, partial [Bacteroidetes bacterium]|nr:hypothetical protein [Bacteroidota bacterium]